MRRRLSVVIGLEIYALLLSALQILVGVRTDEAKYLLNIPYPHPPLGRGLLHAFEWLPGQEIFWRVILATLMVQAVWVVWDMARGLHREARWVMAGAWLLSGGIVLQAGTIMMAPITALQALALLWMYQYTTKAKGEWWFFGAAMLWLAMLFTAYQGILFLPVIMGIMLRHRSRLTSLLLYVCVPVLLLALYTLSNPLALASFIIHGSRETALSFVGHLSNVVSVWMLGGAFLVSVLGTWGLVYKKKMVALLAFILVAAYVFLSHYDYYAVLFVPLFMVGMEALLRDDALDCSPFFPPMVVCSLVTLGMLGPTIFPSVVRPTMNAIDAVVADSVPVFIKGSFGHEWQYASEHPILSYAPDKEATAKVIVCIKDCDAFQPTGFTKLDTAPVPTWVR